MSCAEGSPGSEPGQRALGLTALLLEQQTPPPALQPGQRAHRPCKYSGAWVRGCASTHPGSSSLVRTAPAPPFRLPCPPPRPPSQFRTVGKKIAPNCPTDPTNFGLVFRPGSPQTLRVFGELMSNISATRGRQDMHRLCVCGSPRGDLSHIAGLTIGRSRSDFSGDNWRAQEPYMWGVGLTQQIA